MTEEPGQLIAARYRLVRCLARGGMGSVWQAEHTELGTRVAVKLLRPELARDEHYVERFRREARAAGKLRSPHVVSMHDFGVDQGTAYLAMELLEGEDLELRLGRVGRLEPREALELLTQAARGLAAAHQAGLVHRDVKPANLFIERLLHGERLKVVDFGIARDVTDTASGHTTQSSAWGSPAYMSPEQARGRTLDERTDVWALASVFYKMLTGELPFRGQTEHEIVVEVCTGTATPPSQLVPELPVELDDLFAQAFAKDPQERTRSVTELAQLAARALQQEPPVFDAPGFDVAAPRAPGTSSAPSMPSAPESLPSRGRVTETAPLEVALTPDPRRAPEASAPRRRVWALAAISLPLLVAFGAWALAPRPQSAPPLDEKPSAAAMHAAAVTPSAPVSVAAPTERAVPELAASPIVQSPESTTERHKAPALASSRPRKAASSSDTTRSNAAPSPATDPLFGLPIQAQPQKPDPEESDRGAAER